MQMTRHGGSLGVSKRSKGYHLVLAQTRRIQRAAEVRQRISGGSGVGRHNADGEQNIGIDALLAGGDDQGDVTATRRLVKGKTLIGL
jgi:hypothetical protein